MGRKEKRVRGENEHVTKGKAGAMKKKGKVDKDGNEGTRRHRIGKQRGKEPGGE